MDAQDHGEQTDTSNKLCRLEWIAWAIDAAWRHKRGDLPDPLHNPRSPSPPALVQ